MNKSLAKRSISSISWNVFTSITQVVIGFVRSILLARLLPVEVFGIYGWAGSLVGLTAVVANFGMRGAFLHRAPETEDEKQTAAVHFTLQLMFSLAWAGLLSVGAVAFASGSTRIALLVLTATSVGTQLAHTPRLILTRRVVHRRLALANALDTVLSALVAVFLAWRGETLWALLSTDLITLLVNVVAFYVWRPVWRPHLTWSSQVMRYFLRFGSRNFLADTLLRALDRVDDLWTGVYLGETSMGLYSRAYAFATYPRKVLSAPVNHVAEGAYAALKGDRRRLSQAFFRVNALLVRVGFLAAGSLALVAPEFIRLALGAKWLPMLDAFRLMLVYTLLDPIKLTVAALFVAVGRPELVVKARSIQLIALVVGLFLLGPLLGIAGVALAVDGMLICGIGLLLRQSRSYVDFSPSKLLGAPLVSLLAAMATAGMATALLAVSGSDWLVAGVKIGVFSIVYVGILVLFERTNLAMMLGFLWSTYRKGMSSQARG